MKIAYFTDAYLPNINGVSFSVDVFSRILSAENEIEIYAPAYKDAGKTEQKGKVTVRRYYSVPIPTYKDTHLTLPDVVKIYNQIEEFNPDVVHIQTPGTLGLIGILVAKALRKPVVGTYHTLISEVLVYASIRRSLDKYLQAIDKVALGVGTDLAFLLKQKNEGAADEKKKESIPQRITWSLVNRVYGYCDIVICPSEAIKRELTKRGVKRRIEVVSNGVDLKLFPMRKDYRSTGKIIHVGRLGFEKNIDVVIKAVAKVMKFYPKTKLVIAGDGPARKDLEKLAVSLGIAKNVNFLGMVKRDRLSKVYLDGDVFVTASTMETQGMVVLEAMSSGMPVVGVKKYALPDLVKDGVNGYVTRPGSDKSMADKIRTILDDHDLLKKMGNQSRKIAEKHEVGEMSKRLFELYEEALLLKYHS
jgi:glycosyltransferase involved in cell wall biosynthesis